MITKDRFRMVEMLSQADLEEHPVWADFQDGADRSRVLDWGVDAALLDRELERYDYCGRSPLYPVLCFDALDAVVNASVALVFTLADGRQLPGYRVGSDVFGVFVGGEEFCLNPSLPARFRSEATRLARALGVETLSPLRHAPSPALGGAGPAPGSVEIPAPLEI